MSLDIDELSFDFSSLKIENLITKFPNIIHASPDELLQMINISSFSTLKIVELLNLNKNAYLLLDKKQKMTPLFYEICISNSEAVKNFPCELLNNKSICMKIVSSNAENLRFLPEKFKNDPDILEYSLENDLRSFRFFPENQRNNIYYARRACDIPDNKKYISSEIKKKIKDCTKITIELDIKRKVEKRNVIKKSDTRRRLIF